MIIIIIIIIMINDDHDKSLCIAVEVQSEKKYNWWFHISYISSVHDFTQEKSVFNWQTYSQII